MMRWFPVLLVACTHTEPRPTVIEYEEHGEIVGPGVTPGPVVTPAPTAILVPGPVAIPTKDQPPYVKLKLGHWRNDDRNIGVTIDLLSAATDSVADIDPAKVRFDGDPKIWLLEGHHGDARRIDYVRTGGRVTLSMTADGHATVYIPDPETDLNSAAIELYRDADSDPL